MRNCIVLAALCLWMAFASRLIAEEKLPETVAPEANLVELFGDGRFFEGPTWDPGTAKLYFTAFGDTTQILRLDAPGRVAVWLDNSQGVNGTYLAKGGRLIGAQGNAKKVISMKIGADGPEDVKTLFEDSTANGPNDLCQTPRGDIYVTCPDFPKRESSAVYRISPDGKASKVIDDMTLTNGIIASNDGRTLYVADSWEKHWRAYPINADGTLGEGKLFFNPDTERKDDPDGMSIDEQGNLYFTGRGGVWVVSPEGKSLGLIPVKEFVSNCSFGGPDGKTLYLTCAGKVYSLAMNVRGGQASSEQDASDWPNLLDDQLSAHWHTQGNWSLDGDGVVTLTPRAGEQGWARFDSYLWSKEQYGDFEIKFDYMVQKNGNSGFYFHVSDEKSPVVKGIEVQIYDSASRGPRHKPNDHDSGGIIPGIPPIALAAKPAGEWNQFHITCKGDKVTVVLNGQTVNEVDLNSPSIKDRARSGSIGFQDHALPLSLRAIRVKKL